MSASTSPIALEADPVRKVLKIHYRGAVSATHMAASTGDVEAAVAKLGPGFALLTDLSELDEMDIDSVPHITRVMDVCLAAGVRQIARVIPDPRKDIGFHLLSMTHYRGRVPIAIFDSIVDAERALAP